MKEESSFVSGEASYSFLSSNRPLKCHLAPYSKYSSGKLSNETGNWINFELKPADWSDTSTKWIQRLTIFLLLYSRPICDKQDFPRRIYNTDFSHYKSYTERLECILKS